MRFIHAHPDLTTIMCDEILAKVDVHWDTGEVVISQPNSMGGKIRKSMDEYDACEGDLIQWITDLRAAL